MNERVVLGIDAAWTATQPSGVAVLRGEQGALSCVGLASSFQGFIALSRGVAVDWSTPPTGGIPKWEEVLDAATQLAGHAPDVIAVDMPLSMLPITCRREADDVISRAFGARGCAVHSPSSQRPGPISDAMRLALTSRGFELAIANTPAGTTPALLEVYPHPALLRMLGASHRVPYKAANSTRYWPKIDAPRRRQKLLDEWRTIIAALSARIDGFALEIPTTGTMAGLKRYEDAIDALICAWVGIEYLLGRATPYGDASGAIWT